ncbi:hypothetical protein RhiirA5_496301 [Rhizophagus irregularis]|uniref:MATA-HMG n=4 Tax=Rhizophagus irregularis TaxID=588596 RepID=A0A1B1EVM9_9GLOM|nr:MATA-HMG [Rhizophagus irregularis]EXX76284.1 hypothetical protein RirG_034540 [Rhizophagus irregularis DAOM 197198w]ANQ32869.1 MATA-HMG [Rhizophagus irregularis]ANQ32871.1 MATA-HMG [Rhizophagus irregularis]PKC13222.1 hypothetical protein RhiirA5_496301 [Rhizophagus irregularis]
MITSLLTPDSYVKHKHNNNYLVFDVNSKTKNDEELLKYTDYKFNIEPEILLSNSTTTRLAVRNKKKGINKIPRPQNAWIIYRRDKSVELRRDVARRKQKSKDLSKDIAQMWENEPKEVKELFEALSRMSEKMHVERYGNYKYKPKRMKSTLESSEKLNKPYKQRRFKLHSTYEKPLYVETCGNYKTYKPRITKSLESSNSNSQKSPDLSNSLSEFAVIALTYEHTSSELKSLKSEPSPEEYGSRRNAMIINPYKNFPYNIMNIMNT